MPDNQSDKHFEINQRAELDRIIASASTSAPWLLPLLRAVREGVVNLAQPQRGAAITEGMLELSSRPLIVLVCDDDYESTGPQGWGCTQTLQKWGRAAMIHGAAGEARDYELAVIGALAVGRFVVVECGTATQAAWEAAIAPHMSAMSIRARPDSPHPKPPAAGEVN